MSQLVATMRKFKSDNLNGIQKHNQREISNHSNQEIDVSKAHLNYDLVNKELINYREVVNQTIDSQKVSTRATRKDAVLVAEWLISSDRDFFKELSMPEVRQYFNKSLSFFQERYGKQNIAYAMVHLDETTPHMHIGVVPMKDGKLTAKTLFNRQELRYVQDELPVRLSNAGFNIDRGTKGSQRKKLSVPEYKATMRELEDLKEQKEKLVEQARNTPNFNPDAFEPEYVETRTGMFKREQEATGRFTVDFKELEHIKQTSMAIDGMKETISKQENKIAILLDETYQFDHERGLFNVSLIKKDQEIERLQELLSQSELREQQAHQKALASQAAYKNLESKTLNLFNSFTNYPSITRGIDKIFNFDLLNMSPLKLLNWILSEPQDQFDTPKTPSEPEQTIRQKAQQKSKNNGWDLSR